MKTAFAPHLNRHVKFARKRPPAGAKVVRFGDCCSDNLPAAPAACDYSGPASTSLTNIYGNDTLGDCVVAGGYHFVGMATANAGAEFVATIDQITADYSAIGGYVKGDPSTDQGCDEQTAFRYWSSNGFADGSKLAAWVAINAQNPKECMLAMYLFESDFFGIELPDAWINPFPSSNGFVWDVGSPDPENGHCVVGTGYNAQGILIDSWGLRGLITWSAVAALCTDSAGGQLYALMTPDQLAKGQTKAPNGVDWTLLLQYFAAITD